MEKRRILIIDDDVNVIRETKDMLEELNFEVTFASDAETGLNRMKTARPDLILLDLVLPDKSGFKIAQGIKAVPEYANIPIIAISLKKEDIDKHIAAKSGISDYVEKPIDYEKLLFRIRDILS